MVNNCARQELNWITPKKFQSCSDNWHCWCFWSAFRHFGTHFAESFCMSKSSWMMGPTRSRDMPSCSAIDLAKIQRSSKISSWIWSIISGVVTVLGHPGWGASQVEKSPHLNWATQFLTVAYDGTCSPNVLSEWRKFPSVPCLAGKKMWWQLTSRCCWNRAHCLTCFLSASVTRKDLQFGTWTDPSFQWHYWFRPMTSGSRSGYGLISTPSYIQSYPNIRDKFRTLRSSPIRIASPMKQKTLGPNYWRLLTSQSPLLVSCNWPVILQICAKFQDLLTAQSNLCHQTICHKVNETIAALWAVMPPALQCPVWHRIIVFVLVGYWQMHIWILHTTNMTKEELK